MNVSAWILAICVVAYSLAVRGRLTNLSMLCHLDKGEDLFRELYSLQPLCSHVDSDIIFVTSATSNILSYAGYAVAINYVYASIHGYSLRIVDETEYIKMQIAARKRQYDKDPRWNKVVYLMNTLKELLDDSSQVSSDHKTDKYLVWLDADLAVVNFKLDVKALISQHPDAEVIMSRDKADAPFVSNSGCIIVRVSGWSLRFLELWWDTYDRTRCCDQNALTWMYDRLIPIDIRSKIVLLPASVLNTDFPAYIGPNRYDHMLHLAGLNTLFRRQVFADGFHTVCGVLESQAETQFDLQSTAFPAYLSLDFNYLQRSIISLDHRRLLSLNELLAGLHHAGPNEVAERAVILEEMDVESIRRCLDDIMKYDDAEDLVLHMHGLQDSRERIELRQEIGNAVFELSMWINNRLSQQVLESNIVSDQGNLPNATRFSSLRCCLSTHNPAEPNFQHRDLQQCCQTQILVYQDAVTSSFELLLSQRPFSLPEYGHKILDRVRQIVSHILSHLQTQDAVQARFHYYRFKTHQLEADLYQQELDAFEQKTHYDQSVERGNNFFTQQIVLQLQAAAASWRFLTERYQYYGTDYVLADPHKEFVDLLMRLGAMLCSTMQDYPNGQQSFQEAFEKQLSMVEAYDTIRLATNSIMRQGRITLGEISFNFAACLYDEYLFRKKTLDPNAYHDNGAANRIVSIRKSLQRAIEIFETEDATDTLAHSQATSMLHELHSDSENVVDISGALESGVDREKRKLFKRKRSKQ